VSDDPIGVNIKVLDKDYRIACPPHEQEELMASARLLDARMREIRQTGRVIGSDRIAVVAALNLAHELVQLQRGQGGQDSGTTQRLSQIQERIAAALSAEATLDGSAERV